MKRRICAFSTLLPFLLCPAWSYAQTGVDDDRVSLPEGPGSIEGVGDNVELSGNMGAMSYGVNISVPRGRGGMGPSMRLSYSSSGAVGIMGVGWSMDMPAIERMSSRGMPTYGADDLFAANGGSELVAVEEAGALGRVYRERFEKSFTRYLWKEAGDGAQGYWVAQSPDGTLGFYGAQEDGTSVPSARSMGPNGVAKYHLVERVDPFGNRARYTYDALGSNHPLLTNISYVFVEGQPMYSVELEYEDRPDPISDAALGYEDLLSKRLVRIVARHRDEIVREAELAYEPIEGGSLMSRLSSVQQWGVGGKATGPKDPVAFTFAYQRGLGAGCEGAGCERPYVVDMGTVGASLGSGKATLLDINGDALPDVLDTSQPGAHQFFFNTMTWDGTSFSQSFSSATASTQADGSFALGDKVQTLDVNGDGFSDLLNTETGAFLLKDPNAPDWIDSGATMEVGDLRTNDTENSRFLDYDLDRRIDVLVSVDTTTQILVNTPTGFSRQSASSIGKGFASANLQMSDFNGDGLNDVVEFTSSGQIQFRLNLGYGNWSEWRSMAGVTIALSDRDLAELEDLNGDGRDDIVIVTATQIKYALNRVDRFDDFEVVTSADIEGNLPERVDGTRVLYADMNANGSEDIVWFAANGNVQFVELFPVRPNLIASISNGLGYEQRVRYTTAVEQMIQAQAEGNPWTKSLHIPMPVVAEVDMFVTLTGSEDGTGLHERRLMTYRDGFYDGDEKQFRGFVHTTSYTPGDDAQQAFTAERVFDVGDQGRPHFHGLQLLERTTTEDKTLREVTSSYQECDLDGVPTPVTLEGAGKKPVYYVCQTSQQTQHIEGLPERALTTQMNYTHDGYGNVVREESLGVVDVEGDELTTVRTFAPPQGELWFLNLPVTESVFDEASGDKTLVSYYYDGDDFRGQPAGEYTHGFLSRQTTQADANTTLETLRQRRDAFGNSIETIDANGTLDDADTHRRSYTYGPYGLFVYETQMAVAAGTVLRRESRFDLLHQKENLLTDWILSIDGEDRSARLVSNISYDGLGRQSERFEPGDADGMPTTQFVFEYAEPMTRLVARLRSERGGSVDIERYICFDGRGRLYQTRSRIGSGRYLVSGFTVFNGRGVPVESYQPYESDSAECESARPVGVKFVASKYDGLGRPLVVTQPDAEEFGDQASVMRYAYEPLQTLVFDANDTDAAHPFADTPSVQRVDGLGRLVGVQRTKVGGATIDYQLHYDNTGSFSGYTDPSGHRHEMSVDLAGRITEITNPNFGTVKMAYDAVGNVVRREDARGIVTLNEYDGLNRVSARWDEAKKDQTLVSWRYDADPDCPAIECTNTAGRPVSISFPISMGEELVAGRISYGYDQRGRVLHTGQTWDGFKLKNQQSFDALNRLVEITYPDGVA